jgi:HlyD family secretion protein
MITKYLLPLLALIGFAFGVLSVMQGNTPTPVSEPVAEPTDSPFKTFITGAGIVEARSRNLSVGTPLSGIVTKLVVAVGDQVTEGMPLFYLDDREAQADFKRSQAAVIKAKASLAEAEARLVDARTLRRLIESVTDKRAVSTEEVDRRRNAELIAKANVQSARAGILEAEAGLAAVKTTLDRLVVRAPIAGEVLQVNIRPGEFAQSGTISNNPLMVLGQLDVLHIRVDIDENDAWRYDKNGKAIAYLRGNRRFKADLNLAYVEPYVVPKKSLTGDSTERVDTRVLQALYRFERNQIPAYVGQQMDVYIEASESDAMATDSKVTNNPAIAEDRVK